MLAVVEGGMPMDDALRPPVLRVCRYCECQLPFLSSLDVDPHLYAVVLHEMLCPVCCPPYEVDPRLESVVVVVGGSLSELFR